MAHYKIVSRFDPDKVLYEGEAKSLKDLVASAIKSFADLSSADLSSANLRSADLRSANLSSADLRSANLRSANLSYANLSYANLSFADLSSADLSFANLRSANLSSANLSSANLSYANLSYADLRSANLSSANLRSANLRFIKADFFMTLLHAIPKEWAYLRDALINGKVDGSQYEGECACLKGTLENACERTAEDMGLKHEVSEPAESFFLGINKGDTPNTNQISKIVVEWMDEFEILAKNLA